MKWKNAARDHLPGSSGNYLTAYKGVYYIAQFNRQTGEFTVKDLPAPGLKFLHEELYWIEIADPAADRKLSVLIAEDDPEDQKMLSDAFSSIEVPADVNVVGDGKQVLDYVFRRKAFSHVSRVPDFLILDLYMPEKDGFEVLSELRGNPESRSLPVYVLTSSLNTADLNRALNLGANGLFSKGSPGVDLGRIIRDVYARYRNQAGTDKNPY